MRWTHETLGNARAVVFVVVGILILVAYLMSRV
jgi:hypothetical protein